VSSATASGRAATGEGTGAAAAAPSAAGGGVAFAAIAACFIATGGFALVYEVVFARYLALFLGHTTQAHTIVLATFMGGQALGYIVFGRLADRLRAPVAAYGWLEVALAGYAVLFPVLFGPARDAFLAAARPLDPGGSALLAAKLVSAAALLIGPAFLMGGTLPLLAAGLTRLGGGFGRTIGRLYAANCLGAVVGTLVAGYGLVPGLGLKAGITVAGVLNAGVGLVALLIGSRLAARAGEGDAGAGAGAGQGAEGEEAFLDPGVPPIRAARIAVLGAGLTGAAAMVYEVAWARLLAIALGGSTYAFTVMLAGFIGGIAIGARISASRAVVRRPPLALFAWLQVGAALAVALVLPIADELPYLFRRATDLLARTDRAFPVFQAFQLLACLAVMLGPTVLGGMALPVVARAAAASGREAGRTVGASFAANTTGTVLGATLGGLAIMPLVGVRHTFTAGIALNLVAALIALLGTATAAAGGRRGWRVGAPLAAAAATLLLTATTGISRGALTMQLFRPGMEVRDLAEFKRFAAGRRILFDEDGASATVIVTGDRGGERILFVNGKADASTGPDAVTQRLIAHIPLLLAPRPDEVFVVGLGSGMTVGSALRHPGVKRCDVAEISPEIVRASRLFDDVTGAPLDDPRCRLIVDDARTFLTIADKRYDVIISEPSNPWVAGNGSLFTVEYFRTLARHLTPGGIAVQWVQVYEVSDAIVDLVIRTYAAVFPHMRIFANTTQADLILVGSLEPLAVDLDRIEARFAQPDVLADLAPEGIGRPLQLYAHELLGPTDVRRAVTPGALNVDDRPFLEFAAPRALFTASRARRLVTWALDPARVPAAADRLMDVHVARRGPLTEEDARAVMASLKLFDRWPEVSARYVRAAESPDATIVDLRRGITLAATRDERERLARLLGRLYARPDATADDALALVDVLVSDGDSRWSRLEPWPYEEALAIASSVAGRFPAAAARGRYAEAIVRLRRREIEPARALLAAVVSDPAAPPTLRERARAELDELRPR